mgnify:CR=1 FL=1
MVGHRKGSVTMELGLKHGNGKSQEDVMDSQTLLAGEGGGECGGVVHKTALRCVGGYAHMRLYVHVCLCMYIVYHIIGVPRGVLCIYIYIRLPA